MGEGRIALLTQIEKQGSITKAAKAMNMSYKKAWELVNSMNAQGNSLLVTRKTGGKGGGGATLSDAGKKAIALFNDISKSNRDHLDEIITELDFS